uniref:Uncharacterized protein n=1 Tax=Alexandrium monilatum TaxID=311494 RepID=A0A7S4QB29_9DINO|mmetsp:Transcript_19349/g.58189  ORF Transcript_19349/g.58189 Transcript_19349/m.58189 type:complete len:115 (+) Transcript_19349:98-442(+)
MRETEGIFVEGDRAAIAYLRHLGTPAEGRDGGPPQRALDDTHLFCEGGEATERWLEDRIHDFVSCNMLEPPEDPTATFGQASEGGGGRGRGRAAPRRGQKRPAPVKTESAMSIG